METGKRIYVDIDETIAHYMGVERKYENAIPIYENIDRVNRLYDLGHNITMWTARGTMTGIDYTELTRTQLDSWGVRYHELKMGKPAYDILIDDKALNSIDHWTSENVNRICGI